MAKIKTTARYIRRSPYQALAAFIVMAATFFISGLFLLMAMGSNQVIKYFESRPQISAFFKDSAQSDQISSLQTKINDTKLTSEVKFISKEDALKIYQDQNKNDPLLLELVTANILPASLDISTYNAADLEKISEILSKEEIVDEVVYQKDVVEKLTNWTRIIRIGGVALVAFLTAVSILIVFMVIGMRIAIRREEIKIMRLIGASSWYIKAPFVFEGVLYGVVGALISSITITILILYFSPEIAPFFTGIPLFPIPLNVFIYLIAGQTAAGALIGSLGAQISLRRYLKI